MRCNTAVHVARTLVAGALLACGGRDLNMASQSAQLGANEMVSANATVRYVALEGGCWVLETAAGRYEPTDLPAPFQVDGLAVYAVWSAAPAAVSACMVAPPVTLDTIRTR